MKYLFFALLTFSSVSHAGTTSSSLPNTVTVTSNCSIQTNQYLNFGTLVLTSYSSSAFNRANTVDFPRATGLVSMKCSAGTFALRVNYGVNSQPGVSTCIRVLKNPSSSVANIAYEIFGDPEFTKRLADDKTQCPSLDKNFLVSNVNFTSNNPVIVPIYSQINFINSAAPIGVYSDSLTFSVVF